MTMRTFFLDENLTPDLAEPLCRVYRRHRFATATRWQLRSVDDVDLIADLGRRECDAIVTMDRQQLENPDERDALRAAGLHWIGVPQTGTGGALLLAVLTAIAVPGIHHVLNSWHAKPSAYFLPEGNHGGAPHSEEI